MIAEVYGSQGPVRMAAQRLLVLDSYNRPIICVIERSPGEMIYVHCGEPQFNRYLREFANYQAPKTLVIDTSNVAGPS